MVVSTVYVPRCNFRCPFCHNSGIIETPEAYATIPLKKIEDFILDRKDFIDGICLTGGEPCLHKNKGLFEFFKRIKELGFKTKFDTNGYDPDCLKKILDEKLVDYVAMDIKGPLDERYDKLSGIKTDINKINNSIKLIMESGIDYEFRTTVVPKLLDIDDIRDIAKGISGAKKFALQQFVPAHTWDEDLREVKPYLKEKIDEMVEVSKEFIPNTVTRGI
jgi:pyruvate formate lyase activating enzyme